MSLGTEGESRGGQQDSSFRRMTNVLALASWVNVAAGYPTEKKELRIIGYYITIMV
jgi:hypothetical protein